MQPGINHLEAVRQANEQMREASCEELATYIHTTFGLTIKPPIVKVLLGSLQERAALNQSGQAAYAQIDRWKAENPEEAKKLAAAVKRREAIRQRKAEAQEEAVP
ncbi:MAG: hypothetical protein U0736_11305 [Gemmataceae bacterium]